VLTAAHVEAAYAQVRQQVDAITQRTDRPKPFGLWFRVRLLPVAAVDRLSRRLSGIFRPTAAVPLAGLIAMVAIQTLTSGTSGHPTMMDPGASFLPLLGLFMVSMFAHELGHASASMRYGVPVRDIGFGLYVIYPVFYSDVTAAWRLTRRQRVVIDLAGVYFQLLVGTAYLLVYRLTGWEIFYLAAASIFLLGLFALLPIFKFDGYWLLTDLLGVVNLSRQVRRVTVHILDRLRRKRSARLPWPSWVSVVVVLYGAFSIAYLVLFALRLALVVPDLAAGYATRVAGLLRDLYLPPHTPAPGRLTSILGPTYVLFGVGWASVALSSRAIRALRPSRKVGPRARPR
jgi:putative peptide zinc metalloprotease protein